MRKGDAVPREAGAEGNDRQFVTALARGLAILRAFRPHDPPLGNQEIAARTGLPKPTVSRLTRTLTELGYLTYHARAGSYELGGGVLTLGYAAMTNLNILGHARPLMRALAESSGATVGIGTREQGNMVFLEVCLGSALVTMRAQPGSRMPIASTAMGRAYLYLLGPGERAAQFDRLRAKHGAAWPELRGRIEASFDCIARDGFCMSEGDWQPGLNGVAAPLRGAALSAHYVLDLGAPSYLMPAEQLRARFGPALVAVAQQLTHIAGGQQPAARAAT